MIWDISQWSEIKFTMQKKVPIFPGSQLNFSGLANSGVLTCRDGREKDSWAIVAEIWLTGVTTPTRRTSCSPRKRPWAVQAPQNAPDSAASMLRQSNLSEAKRGCSSISESLLTNPDSNTNLAGKNVNLQDGQGSDDEQTKHQRWTLARLTWEELG